MLRAARSAFDLQTRRVRHELALAVNFGGHFDIDAVVAQDAIERVALASNQRPELRFGDVESVTHVLRLTSQQPLGVRRINGQRSNQWKKKNSTTTTTTTTTTKKLQTLNKNKF
jgi:hypothetical protein